jgi:hypothetical protein
MSKTLSTPLSPGTPSDIKFATNIKIEQLTKHFAEQFKLADELLSKAKKDLSDNRIAYITAEANYREAQKNLTNAKYKIYNLQIEFDEAITKLKSHDDTNASNRIRRVIKSRQRSKSCGKSTVKKTHWR